MRDYRLHELNDEQFESLVGLVCNRVLGTGSIVFAKGKDGGKDGRFEGTAQSFPSTASPWTGKFVVQAKHTTNPVASCSDNDFATNASSVVDKEIPRILKLRENGQVDNYLLFTNRKLPGGAESRIREKIVAETGVQQVALIGREKLNQWLNEHPEIVQIAGLQNLLGPLRIRPQDLKEVILALESADPAGLTAETAQSFEYRETEEKNRLNQLGEAYFRHMRESSEPYFERIRRFLEDPINAALERAYRNTAAEINNKVAIRRDQFGAFEEVFESIYDQIVQEGSSDRPNSRLLWTLLHYMYCSCDIGQK